MKILKFNEWKLYEADEPAEETPAEPEATEPTADEPIDTGSTDTGSTGSTDTGEGGEGDDDDEITVYKENPEYRVNLIMTELSKKIKYWFKYGRFKKYFKLEDITKSQSIGEINTRMYVQFSNKKDFYILQFMLRTVDATEDVVERVFIELKKYDYDQTTLDNTWMGNVKLKNITEDYMIKKIKQMQNRADVLNPPKNKKQAKSVLSDKDTFNDMFY